MKKNTLKKILAFGGVISACMFSLTLTSCAKKSSSESITKTYAVLELKNYKNLDNYSSEGKAEINNYINEATDKINNLTDTADIYEIVSTYKTKIDSVSVEITKDSNSVSSLDSAKTRKNVEIMKLAKKYPDSNYRSAEVEKKATIVSAAKAAVATLTSKKEVEAYSLDNLKASLDELKLASTYQEEEKAALQEKKAQIVEEINTLVSTYEKHLYRSEQVEEINTASNNAKTEVNKLKNMAAANAYTLDSLKETLDAILTDEELTLIEAKDAKIDEIEALADTYPDENYKTEELEKKNAAVDALIEVVLDLDDLDSVNAVTLDELETFLKSLKTKAEYEAEA